MQGASALHRVALDIILFTVNHPSRLFETNVSIERKVIDSMQYFVVMIDYGRRGREAVVDPEITRRDVVARVASGEYTNISFIHEVADRSVDDVTEEILAEAALPEVAATEADLQARQFDHIRDLRKHERT